MTMISKARFNIRWVNWILVTTLMVMSASHLRGQYKVSFFEAGLSLFQPVGPFGNNNSNRMGIEMGYLRQIKQDKPSFWGISIYYTNLGSESGVTTHVVDYYYVTFDESTTSNVLGFDGRFRFYPDIYLGPIECYVEGHLGYKWLYTLTSLTVQGEDSSDTNFDSGSLSLTYGASVGLQIPIASEWYLNAKASYLPGLSVDYYSKNPKNTIQDKILDAFDKHHSTTDIVRYDLGVTYRF
ncbi:MAG: hypothetical protein J5I52_04520 [Saprospiraceae bacterium]|nr:MAG: hypothetical protein UZ09_BCD002000856 [Bacteroidetes bacterium OLB9]MCO6463395.1 hypothetical protein [Saprospiraceae bacterium]